MSDWSLLGDGQRFDALGELTASSDGTVITTGVANTKGSYVEIVASSAFDASGVLVQIGGGGSNDDFLVDIAVGAAASEEIILSNLYFGIGTGAASNLNHVNSYCFLVGIPSGTRIAARAQANGASVTIEVIVTLLAQGFVPSSPLGQILTMGATTADSGGVGVDPGTTANTKGAWSEIIASTSRVINLLWIAPGNQDNGTRAAASILLDIGVGAAASEVVVLPDLHLNGDSNARYISPQVIGPIAVSIPSGTRIAARAQADGTGANQRLFDVILYGGV